MKYSISALTAILCFVIVEAQAPTLRQRIALEHADVAVTVNVDQQAIPFFHVLKQCDLIVRGRIGEPAGHFSSDERDIYTTYPIVNPEVLFTSKTERHDTPGVAQPPLTVLQRGGVVRVDGFKAIVHYDDIATLIPGTDVILLLRNVEGQHWIAGDGAGAFAIRQRIIEPLLPRDGEHKQFAGREARAFLNEVVAKRRAIQ